MTGDFESVNLLAALQSQGRKSFWPRIETKQKKLADDARLLPSWRRYRRERLDAMLASPHAEALQALLNFLKKMTGPAALIDFVKRGPWRDAHSDVRAEILALLDAVIIKRRERMDLVPFDDALPDRQPNVFLILREHLFPPMAAPPGA
jgi:hypothetical protein